MHRALCVTFKFMSRMVISLSAPPHFLPPRIVFQVSLGTSLPTQPLHIRAMKGSWTKPCSDNPNAPQIPVALCIWERMVLPRCFLSAITYGTPTHVFTLLCSPCLLSTILGIAMILFFQCMGALLNSIDFTRAIRWGLVAHTAAMFSTLTANAGMSLDIFSISYIDNRQFPGNLFYSPGPLGYQFFIFSGAISIVPNAMFYLNNSPTDGLLVSSALN